MARHITLNPASLRKLREVDPKLVSYNIEMTEVTGGTFWREYTPAQIAGTEEFPPISDWSELGKLMQVYPPIDLYNERLRALARELGPAWVRVSGTWANKTYYDFDGSTGGKPPKGFQSVLTQAQWRGVLDFVRDIGAKLLVSVANCEGVHAASEPWNPAQAKLLFDYSRDYGVPVDAAEFTNEPNMLSVSGLPAGYTTDDFARDHDIFCRFVRENYPDMLIVGPCTVGDVMVGGENADNPFGGGIASSMTMVTTDELIGACREKMDVFSYHYYNGISERGAVMGGHWPASAALTDRYLAVAGECARKYAPLRDKYVPGGQMWVTESGDAGCGGDTWASTFLDVPRTLNELGEFCTVTDGVIFHNTLASSDYGYLRHGTFEPRPNYFAVLLWNRLMGTEVYDAGEGAHVYAHSRRDGKPGAAYLIVNNGDEPVTAVLSGAAERYTLTAESVRSSTMLLNGAPLSLGEGDALPELSGEAVPAGELTLPAASATFLVV